MINLFETISAFFKEQEWPTFQLEGETTLQTSFQGDNGKWTCYARTVESSKQIVFYSVYPVNVPEAKRTTMAEFITRANYGLIVGNFEMDYEDGELRYKTSVGLEGEEPSPALLRHLVFVNVLTTDKYLPGIMKLAYNDISATEALKAVE
ncbi:MAG: YbjN domain-containing protein [Chloroflexi bacterium]|nr:YbjN domain-containing protein [Chloroflexota bacterium]